MKQEPYYAASETRNSSDERSWYIPLNFATQSNPNFDDTLFYNYILSGWGGIASAFPPDFDTSQWIIFNKQQIGYYRVNYDESNWKLLIKALNSDRFEDIHVVNRAQLIDDSLNFAFDGYSSYEIAFDVLSYLSRETDYVPWKAAANNLDKLDTLLKGQPLQANFRRLIHHLLRKMYIFYGLENKSGENSMDKFGRELAVEWTCRMGDKPCLKKLSETVHEMAVNGLRVPATLEVTYICQGLRGPNRQTEFNNLWLRMRNTNDQAERLRILDGLVCSSDPALLKSLLTAILTDTVDTNYRSHERSRVFNNVITRSSVGIDLMIDFISEFYYQILSK